MPEGPEIRLAADQIAQAIVGYPTSEVYFAFEHLKDFQPILSGVKVTAVETYGKAILTRFANELNIYTHNQLYGQWTVRDAYDFPDTTRQLRLAIHNQQHSALLYSASDIQVLHNSEVQNHPFLSTIGPDLLDPDLTVNEVIQRYLSTEFRKKRLSTLLLNQRFLAGLGNYLRSEVLFVAGLHYIYRPIDCTPAQIDALASATLELTRQSYHNHGVTNDLRLAKQLKASGWHERKYRWWVFERDGDLCHKCQEKISKADVGGRRIYFCPNCQRPPPG